MHRYDYSFLKKSVPGNIVGLTDIISDLRTKEEFRKIDKNCLLYYMILHRRMFRSACVERLVRTSFRFVDKSEMIQCLNSLINTQ